MSRIVFLFILLCAGLVSASDESPAVPDTEPQKQVSQTRSEEAAYIGNVINKNASPHYTIVVETVPKKLYLLKIENDSQTVIDSADILTGRENGSKIKQNDGKTPEGVYYTNDFMTREKMSRSFGEIAYRYGTAAYPTNYPNPIDKIYGRTGYGIWLHGLDPDRHKPATEGCVAMQNIELERMMPYLSVGMPLVIINNALFMTKEEYENQRTKHLNDLYAFIKAWNSADYDTFKEFIHPKYSSYSARSASAYLDTKKSLMHMYPDKQITVDNINIYRQNDQTLVYDVDQFYCADNLVSYGNKKFYLVYDDGTEKLVSEEIKPYPVNDYIDPHIKTFVEEWKKAWQSMDIDRYMKYYAHNFPARDRWEDNKRKLFDENGSITVGISDLRWESAGGNSVRITFRQDYTAEPYASSSAISSDKGIKTLVVSGCPGSYTIKSENWRAI